MKKKFYNLFIVLFLISGLGATAQTYNANDLSRLKDFMEQSVNGKRNIDLLWDKAPATLDSDGSNWVSDLGAYVKWNGNRLQRIEAAYKALNGKLNLSDCTGLTYIYMRDNNLTEVNLKGCSSLEVLFVCINQIATFNLEGCYNIKEMAASSNKHTTFDISNRKKLFNLYIPNNKLTSINVTGCSDLESLTFTKGNVATVDLSGCPKLNKLECYGNQISSIDLSKNTNIQTLTLASGSYTNPLTSLNINGCQLLSDYTFISSFTNLQSLDITNCNLSKIDLSKNTKLTNLEAGGQKLKTAEQSAVGSEINVKGLELNGITLTPSNGGSVANGIITWSSLPSGRGTYSYDFTTALPTGATGTPFGGTVSVPWVNSSPVSNIAIDNASHRIYSNNGILYIQSETPQAIRIYNLTGQIIKQSAQTTDASFALNKGIYIVQLGNSVIQKVIVK